MKEVKVDNNRSELNAVIMAFMGVFLVAIALIFHYWLLSDLIESFIGRTIYSDIPIDDRKYLAAPAFFVPLACMFCIAIEVFLVRLGMGKLRLRIIWE